MLNYFHLKNYNNVNVCFRVKFAYYNIIIV